jgi:predicted dienelactone hydrolase
MKPRYPYLAAWLRRLAALVVTSLLAPVAMATQAGWRQITLANAAPGAAATTVALYYPTQAPQRAIAMGPFTVQVAINGAPETSVKGLIVLSHGTGGSELGHSSLAEALARAGYLVAALRHPGDNWQDRSMLVDRPQAYFSERPQQVSRVIDGLLGDPQWAQRIARDARGAKVGVLGHSAGGYTALALVGGQAELSRIATHCRAHRADDPIFCGMRAPAPEAAAVTAPTVADSRVRAVAALAPLGVMFTAASLASVTAPVAVFSAQADRWLVPRFHAHWIAQNVPRARLHRVANAWHFAFMDTPNMAIETEDGDIRDDPPGFDRAAFLKQLATELVAFFDEAMR